MRELPEKWCIKITEYNLEFCKNLENRELGFDKGYSYSIGGYYSSISSDNGYKGDNLPNGRTEITFEEFEYHILNKKDIKSEDMNYLIPILEKYNIK